MRFLVSLLSALICTGGIFLLMVNLSQPSNAENLMTKTTLVEFNFDPKDTKLKTRVRVEKKLPKKDALKPLPSTPTHQKENRPKNIKPLLHGPQIPNSIAGFEPGLINTGGELGGQQPASTGGGGPQIIIQPQYPERARQNKVEGFVTLKFSVNAMGRPDNISIVKASPKGYFEKSARRAVSRWKYPVDSTTAGNVKQVTLDFKLEG